MPNFYCMQSYNVDGQETKLWINVNMIESLWQNNITISLYFVGSPVCSFFRYKTEELAKEALQALLSFCKQGA